jgi:hypothetical protein
LVRFHDLSGLDALAHVVSKMFRHLFAVTDISIVSVGQITAEQCQGQTVAGEFLAGRS